MCEASEKGAEKIQISPQLIYQTKNLDLQQHLGWSSQSHTFQPRQILKDCPALWMMTCILSVNPFFTDETKPVAVLALFS